MTSVQIIGVYPIPAREPVHLIEMLFRGCDCVVDLAQFTQPQQGQPRSNWQVPWMESILEEKGERLLSQPYQACEQLELWHGDFRLVFYFHYLDLNERLMTPFGTLDLPQPSGIPSRLLNILSYEEPG